MKTIFTLCYILLSFWATAQFTAPEIGELFRDDVVPRVDILIPADSLALILQEGNEYSDYPFHATFIYNNGTLSDTLENVGFRLRGNTSRLAKKKSFKIEFNEYVSGRKYQGVEKMNLNSQYLDPTISRGKMGADILRAMGIPSIRSNHTLLYINNEFYGVYINTENVDEEYILKRFGNNNGNFYKCRYPASLKYLGDDPNLYKFEVNGERPYTLKINKDEDDYTDLATFIKVLNNTATNHLPCELEKVFNVDAFLKQIVFDVLTGNWDGSMISGNNYYLYHNTNTDKFEFIPWDLDKTFGIDLQNEGWADRNIYDWSPQDSIKPLYGKIMAVPEYRNRFSYYVNETITNIFNTDYLNPKWDTLEARIQAFVAMDTFYNKDFNYTITDFHNGFNGTVTTTHTPINVKNYVALRRDSALAQITVNDIAPVISSVQYPKVITVNENFTVSAKVIDNNTISQVQICHYFEGQPEVCEDMTLSDGVYTFAFTAPSSSGNWACKIIATDNMGQTSHSPTCESHRAVIIDPSNVTLVVNEFLASNDAANQDEHGDYDDWVEIYNYGTTPVFLGDKYLSDKSDNPTKWKMPNISMAGGEFLVFWCDKEEHQGQMHTNFKLSSGGEFIGIFDTDSTNNALIDGYTFGTQTTDIAVGRIPDGTGNFMPMSINSPGQANQTVANENIADASTKIDVYPNPFQGLLNIAIKNPKGQTLEVAITNVLGKKIYGKYIQNTSKILWHHETLPSGVYFVTFRHQGEVIQVQRVLKE